MTPAVAEGLGLSGRWVPCAPPPLVPAPRHRRRVLGGLLPSSRPVWPGRAAGRGDGERVGQAQPGQARGFTCGRGGADATCASLRRGSGGIQPPPTARRGAAAPVPTRTAAAAAPPREAGGAAGAIPAPALGTAAEAGGPSSAERTGRGQRPAAALSLAEGQRLPLCRVPPSRTPQSVPPLLVSLRQCLEGWRLLYSLQVRFRERGRRFLRLQCVCDVLRIRSGQMRHVRSWAWRFGGHDRLTGLVHEDEHTGWRYLFFSVQECFFSSERSHQCGHLGLLLFSTTCFLFS